MRATVSGRAVTLPPRSPNRNAHCGMRNASSLGSSLGVSHHTIARQLDTQEQNPSAFLHLLPRVDHDPIRKGNEIALDDGGAGLAVVEHRDLGLNVVEDAFVAALEWWAFVGQIGRSRVLHPIATEDGNHFGRLQMKLCNYL